NTRWTASASGRCARAEATFGGGRRSRNGTGVPPTDGGAGGSSPGPGARGHHRVRSGAVRSGRWVGRRDRPDPMWSSTHGRAPARLRLVQVISSPRAIRMPLGAALVGGVVGMFLLSGGLFLA